MKPYRVNLLLILLTLLSSVALGEEDHYAVKNAKDIAAELTQPVLVPKSANPELAKKAARVVQRINLHAIQFQYDSTELADEASAKQVENLANALKMATLKDARISLVGHASSDGDDQHNLGLSLRRAQKIKQILIDRHHINAVRILIDGKGESEPLSDQASTSPLNRRVEIIREL